MTKLELIAQYRQQYPTIQVGSNLTGYTTLDQSQYEQTLSDWADAALRIQSVAYREQRAAEYPPIGDQLDALFHAGVFPAEMSARIQAVKDRYPKGN